MIAVSAYRITKQQLIFPGSSSPLHYIPSSFSSLSAKEEGLREPAGRGGEDLQLTAGDGDRPGPGGHHPGHPADLPGPEAAPRRGLLSANQADQSRASA